MIYETIDGIRPRLLKRRRRLRGTDPVRGRGVKKRRRPRVELLETRRLLAADVEVSYRNVNFEVIGAYMGSNPGTYQPLNATPPECVHQGSLPPRAPYLDTYQGAANGTGSIQYITNLSGQGGMQLDVSGSGSDNIWSSYSYVGAAAMSISDNGGQYLLNAVGGTPPTYTNIVWSSCGAFIDARSPGGIPSQLSGTWSPDQEAVTYTGEDAFIFQGTIDLIPIAGEGATDIAVEQVTMSENCVKVDVGVSGSIPEYPHTQEIGRVIAEWLDIDGQPISRLIDEPVYWNTESVTLQDASPTLPADAWSLRVTASIAGDSDPSNNEVVRDYSPDWIMSQAAWGDPTGVDLTYEVV